MTSIKTVFTIKNLEEYKKKVDTNDVKVFTDINSSYLNYLYSIKVNSFRHIHDLSLSFDSPVTIISGENRIGKTSILLLIACSFEDFRHLDSTKPETSFRRFTWKDVISFTKDETDNGGYSYELHWRVGSGPEKSGEGKRGVGKQSWTGLGKLSHTGRINAKIRNREVRFIDLDRMHPARGCSKRLNFKASHAEKLELSEEITTLYRYIFRISEDISIYQTGSHINKKVFLIAHKENGATEAYSSFNDASGEEAVLNMLLDITEAGDNALILIDELECGIHPETQRRLADVIEYLSWTKKQQFIITTHSATLLSAFSKKSRKLIEYSDDKFRVISKPEVAVVFSKLDSISHPLVRLYCEDSVASFCVKKLLVAINEEKRYFDRYINVVESGPASAVKNDYQRHKYLFEQMTQRIGYCCVLDGDMRNNPDFQDLQSDSLAFFLCSNEAPELFLCRSFLEHHPNKKLHSFITMENHHAVFQEMVTLGLAVNTEDALSECWKEFSLSDEYVKLLESFKKFIFNVVLKFS